MFDDLKVNVEWFASKEIEGFNGSTNDYYFVDWINGAEEGCFPVCRRVYESGETEIFIDYFTYFDWHDSSEGMRKASPEELMEQLDEVSCVYEGSYSQDELIKDFENYVMTLVEREF